MADEAKGTEGVEERVKSLEEALSLEKAKNEVLMEQVLKSENTLAEKDLEGFSDVIPNEDRTFWRGQLLENRENATGILSRMFVDNGTPSIQTRLARHEMVIHALLWVMSVAAGTAIAGIVSAGFMLAKLLAKTGGA